MPSTKAQREQLDVLLRSLESGDYESTVESYSEETILQQAAIDLIDILGYSGDTMYLDTTYQIHPRTPDYIQLSEIHIDVMVAADIIAPPHIAVKVFQNPQPDPGVIYSAALSSGARTMIALSDEYITLAHPPYDPKLPGEVFMLSEISEVETDHLLNALSPPNELPTGRAPRFPPGHHPDQTKLTRWLFSDSDVIPEYKSEINTEHFQIDIDEYADLLYHAYNASSPNEKGDALEEVAAFLFDGLAGLSIRDRNLWTQSREIDLVLEQTAHQANFFSPSTRFMLVECKNKNDAMSVQELDNFIGNLRETGIEFGIIVSWNGISGEKSGKNAAGVIDNTDNKMNIITITSIDLYEILDGKSLYEIIDERLYRQQFNL